jgi:hypothetical protein
MRAIFNHASSWEWHDQNPISRVRQSEKRSRIPVVLIFTNWSGHASLATTDRYAKVDLEMKRKAIAQVKPVPRQTRTPWSRDPTVLDWLESL